MSGKNAFLYLGVAAAAYYVYKTYILGAGLNFVPLGADLQSGTVAIGVQNPTNTPVTLLSFVGTVYNGNTGIANVSNFQGITIQPNAQTTLQFKITPNYAGIAANIIDQINNGVSVAVTLKGVANVGGASLPINITF